MMNIGWVVQSFNAFTKYNSTEESFEISKVAVELLIALVGDETPLIDVVRKSLAALEKNDGALTLFSESCSSSQKQGNFQIVPCTTDKNNQVNVAFLTFYFSASKVEKN